ncbi:ABC transporter substrate-binding protein [Paralcaligenes ureilyticus]|uniref:ABC-type nitrate/sulfonate/bicarbonate transport system substrate-binding protein n=1 Tax=Paralcaligenes ureilyticus TaxID=627131 RepID=A0A4V2UXI7_9BURK|nr:ABC transporter substrate-binding protein [Paralcaligenes ureilyticus]TCT03718.1 ABC-type nitrate/sulfonate/bicarbonate transport system substrate-binding protein [Paralcaligenes ureilyticus]
MKKIGLIHSFLAPLALCSGLITIPAHADTQVVRYQEYPGSILHLSNWVMREKGFCKKQGLDCQPIMLANGPLAQQAAAAGSVDLIVSSMDVMLQAVAKGNDLMVIGPLVKNNIYSLSVGAKVERPNAAKGYPENMKDLANKRIGVTARGSGTEMYVKSLMRGAGVPLDNVTFIGVGAPSSAYASLVANQVDAILSWDPIPAICNATKQCSVAVDMRKGEGPDVVKAMNGGFVVWQARREYVQKHGAVIDKFMVAQKEAFDWLKDPKNFEEAKTLATERFKLGDVPNRDKVVNQVVHDMIGQYDTTLNPQVVDGFNQFLLSNKLIAKPVDKTNLIYKSKNAS